MHRHYISNSTLAKKITYQKLSTFCLLIIGQMYAGSGDLPHISSVGAASSSGQNELKLHDPKQFPPLAFPCLERKQKNPKTYDKNQDQEIHGVTKRVYEKFLKDEGDEEIKEAIQGGCEAFIQEIANIKDTHTDDTVWPDTDSEGYACAEQVRLIVFPNHYQYTPN